MVFSSFIFLFLFLPIALISYFCAPKKFKNFILLIISLFFYAWAENILVVLLIGSSILDYSCGIIIESGRKKLGLTISILFNLLILFSFKYLNFTFDNLYSLFDFLGWNTDSIASVPRIVLPIGISFYTFQTMSYTIDVYRGNVKANRNFIDFAAYVSMFPQLVAGPIIRYADIHTQLKSRIHSMDKFNVGVQRVIIGLAKKVLISDTFASIGDSIFTQDINDLSTPYAWLGIISVTIQFYFDFSGYSDMAIGLGKMFGFDFLENFNYPYISKNMLEFWKRWHISLSSWVRDYVYISLGGNRKGAIWTYFNLVVVFFVIGLWHGASWNFIVWGLFHGTFILIEKGGFDKVLSKLWRPIQHFYMLMVLVTSLVFFRTDNLAQAISFMKKMFVFSNGNETMNSYLNYFHLNFHTLLFLIVAIVFCFPVYKSFMKSKFSWAHNIIVLSLLFLSILYLNADKNIPFLYFRF